MPTLAVFQLYHGILAFKILSLCYMFQMDTDKLDFDVDDVLTLFDDIQEELLKEGTSCYNTHYFI